VTNASSSASASTNEDVRSANAFTAHLYARVAKTPGNMLVSGTSLRTALGIALLGARGETAKQMASALELPQDRAKAIDVAKAETAAWNDARGSADLALANRLWADKSFPLKDDFASAAKAAFGTGVEPIDFASSPSATASARRSINGWVSEKTHGKIPEILGEGTLDASTRMVVTNALTFKARWASPFQESDTKNEPFTTFAKSAAPVTVPTMHDTAQHAFAQVGHAKVLELAYDGSPMGMLLVLPDDVRGLADLERGFSAETFEFWTKALASQRVAVSLPKLSFAWGGPVDRTLQELGMRDAFSPKADFKDISENAGLQLSHVVQKTWVSVDEHGTEAAASTGTSISVTSAPMGPVVEFKADHPFIFVLYDTKRGRILFAGRVHDPR
jgi:serpin B